jgi:arginyl-tRNA synthetase
MVHDTIANRVAEALQKIGLQGNVVLEHPSDLSHGDFSCNVAMVLAKQVGESPRELAEKIVAAIPEHEDIATVEVAGPGFINFRLSEKFFTRTTSEVSERWGRGESQQGQRVMVEYTDPNPFKELHIGHLVPNALGESLARLHEYAGAEVRRVTFQGDVGMHVAKAIWGLQKIGYKAGDTIAAHDLGTGYATGATAYEDDTGAAKEIKELNTTIYTRSDDEVNALYDAGKAASIAHFEEAYELLGSDFDHYFFESATGPLGQAEVEKNIGTIFEESEGAVIFRGEEYGLHTRVFINQEGLPTYESKDIGLILAKKDWWPCDTAITVTGTEQESYFTVVAKVAELLELSPVGSIKLVPNGMLKLTEGKMSSRTGDVIPALVFIRDLTSRVKERMQEADDNIAEEVAVGAVKYAILKNSAGKDITFDPNNSIALEGDTGPYVQYTYARAESILRKAGGKKTSSERGGLGVTEIERLLYRFPGVVERAVREYEPHYVANYLSELATAFNSWYAHEQVLDGGVAQGYKLAVTQAVATTLKNGLWLLGIKTPEKM